MRVRMLQEVHGGLGSFRPRDEVTLPLDVARAWKAAGVCTLLEDDPAEKAIVFGEPLLAADVTPVTSQKLISRRRGPRRR